MSRPLRQKLNKVSVNKGRIEFIPTVGFLFSFCSCILGTDREQYLVTS